VTGRRGALFLRLCEGNRHLREFNDYLSACVSAARAVTWIMHAEYPGGRLASVVQRPNDVRS